MINHPANKKTIEDKKALIKAETFPILVDRTLAAATTT
jgi:hypothetical protein